MNLTLATAVIAKLSDKDFGTKWHEVTDSYKTFFKPRKNNDLDSKVAEALNDITLSYPIIYVKG